MAEEASDVAQAVGLVAVDRVIVFSEGLLEQICPEAVEFGEAFADEAEEFRVCLLLRTTFDQHRW